MADGTKAEVFTDRREFLLATTGDKRKAWKTSVSIADESKQTVYEEIVYGLANTQKQYHAVLADAFFETKKLTREELHAEMRAELAKATESEQ